MRDGNSRYNIRITHVKKSLERSYEGWKRHPADCAVRKRKSAGLERSYEGWKRALPTASEGK